MTTEQITAERDRLRAALEAVLPIAERYRPKPDLEYAACCELGREALANTSAASTESVNKELLDLARNVGGSDDWFEGCADLNTLRATLREFQTQARAAIAKAEQG